MGLIHENVIPFFNIHYNIAYFESNDTFTIIENLMVTDENMLMSKSREGPKVLMYILYSKFNSTSNNVASHYSLFASGEAYLTARLCAIR